MCWFGLSWSANQRAPRGTIRHVMSANEWWCCRTVVWKKNTCFIVCEKEEEVVFIVVSSSKAFDQHHTHKENSNKQTNSKKAWRLMKVWRKYQRFLANRDPISINQGLSGIPYRGKISELVGVLIRRGKISSSRGIFVTFPRPKFQIRHFPPIFFSTIRYALIQEIFSFQKGTS